MDRSPAIGDLGRLPGRILILGLGHPQPCDGKTYLCFGRLAFLFPTKTTPLQPTPPNRWTVLTDLL